MTAQGKPGYDERTRLTMILGPATCPTCLESLASTLHRELCADGQEGQP